MHLSTINNMAEAYQAALPVPAPDSLMYTYIHHSSSLLASVQATTTHVPSSTTSAQRTRSPPQFPG